MTNVSQDQRIKMLNFLELLKNNSNDEQIKALNEIENFILEKRYGLLWERHTEDVNSQLQHSIPIFIEDESKRIINDPKKPQNYLLEGDNLHSLHLLEKTHKGKIDVISIDPPYNRGKNDFIYDDKIVDSEDGYKHSKWLSFMYERLVIAHRLLSPDGIITINIDEHEVAPLQLLMDEIFGERNNIGPIIWNKKNPKGDSSKISTMHEYIMVYSKDYESIKLLKNFAVRKKPNAEKIIQKAKSLYKLIGKKKIPSEIASYVKAMNYSKEIQEQLKVEYNLEIINKEFRVWLSQQNFSGGEKAYKNIDENGKVYRGVSMAWPNKKKAPDDYFIPLIHPITGETTPVPERGWRNPPNTMAKLLKDNRILFGIDENKQPERKYFLEENMMENTPSIYENADSADAYMKEIGIAFDYPKPLSEALYLIRNIHPNPKIVLDFFAGSATTAHAVLELNNSENREIQYIMCTNNQNGIAENTAYKRLQIESENYQSNLKYYKTSFIKKEESLRHNRISEELLPHIKCLVELENGIDLSISNEVYLVQNEDELDELFVQNIREGSTLLIPNFVLFNGIQQEEIYNKSIRVIVVPDYYFADELREVGEL